MRSVALSSSISSSSILMTWRTTDFCLAYWPHQQKTHSFLLPMIFAQGDLKDYSLPISDLIRLYCSFSTMCQPISKKCSPTRIPWHIVNISNLSKTPKEARHYAWSHQLCIALSNGHPLLSRHKKRLAGAISNQAQFHSGSRSIGQNIL